jgi:hypothetical protein
MKSVQLADLCDSNNPDAVFKEVKQLFRLHYSYETFTAVEKSYILVKKLFTGTLKGYRGCNTEYHDLNHTMSVLLASARILDGINIERKIINSETAASLLSAALLHDAGYIQEEWDIDGTGAKYMPDHVERSAEFLKKNINEIGLDINGAASVEKLIRCTHLKVCPADITFSSDGERIAAGILATADVLGKMSDRMYLEKLTFLYRELQEAGIEGMTTEFDIIRKTMDFYSATMMSLNDSCEKLYRYAAVHFKERHSIDSNLYMSAIRRNIAYLYMILDDKSTNFRNKLKRNMALPAA